MMADQDEQTYEQWLKVNPAPNFAALIARHGSYEAIPPLAWTAFADAQLEWERRRRARAAPRTGCHSHFEKSLFAPVTNVTVWGVVVAAFPGCGVKGPCSGPTLNM